MMKDHKKSVQEYHDNFTSEDQLKKFKNEALMSSLYVSRRLGKKKLWKPNKYLKSRRVPIAESFNELINM